MFSVCGLNTYRAESQMVNRENPQGSATITLTSEALLGERLAVARLLCCLCFVHVARAVGHSYSHEL